MPSRVTLDEVMNGDVLTACPGVKTSEAVEQMARRRAGSIVVVDAGRPVGIFTERDLIYKVVLPKLDPETTPISAVMTPKIVSLQRSSTIEDAHSEMTSGNFRHLLVMDNGQLVGIVSIKDLIRFRERALEQMVEDQTAEIRKVRDELAHSLELLNREMESAGKFQKELVAKKQPKIPGLRISHVYEQESSIGGDFFEVARLGRGRAGIFMADVMGHGITSAMIAIELKLKFDQLARDAATTCEAVGRLNDALIPLMPDGYFVAGFYGVADLERMNIEFTQFGLPKPTLLHAGSMRVHPLGPANMPLGFKKKTEYKSGVTDIHPGDRLLLFTDGCTEQKNRAGRQLGDRRFVELFKKMVRGGERNIAKQLYREVLDFAGGRPIKDDIAILLCEFTGTRA